MMFPRLIEFPSTRSFFLFGARGTGKSTLVRSRFEASRSLYLDLLLPSVEESLSHDPERLYRQVKQLPPTIKTIIIDEVQKLPKLLDVVHKLIFEGSHQFVLTGSSARKLLRGSSNLLAGRAFERRLHPLTHQELGGDFNLSTVLAWGSLPDIFTLDDLERAEYLRAYARVYLKEEVWGEHLVRKLDPFRKFLEVAAQHNGTIINYSGIAKDVGADPKTVREYFQILEDTLLGFILEPYLGSLRQRVHKAPKFYFFDIGVCRALSSLLTVEPAPSTSYFGSLFEHFFILELIRREAYAPRDYRFHYLATENAELDLVIERPGKPLACIEIKSGDRVRPEKLRGLKAMRQALPDAEFYCVSRDPVAQRIDSIQLLHWQEAFNVL